MQNFYESRVRDAHSFYQGNLTKEFLYEGIINGGIFLVEDSEGQLLDMESRIYERKEEYFIMQPNILYHHFLMVDKQENIMELKIFSVTESSFLKKAVMEYQAIHPDVKITYDFMAHKTPENSQEMDALLKRVNTEIISEQAADIYVLDELFWESYAQISEHLDGMLKGYHKEEGTFAMPLFFCIGYLVYRKEMEPLVPYEKTEAELDQFYSGMLIGVHSQTQYPGKACDFLQFLASYTDTYMPGVE